MDPPLIRLKELCIVCLYAQCLYASSNARINAAAEIIGFPSGRRVKSWSRHQPCLVGDGEGEFTLELNLGTLAFLAKQLRWQIVQIQTRSWLS